ncbi:hypothetical protein GLOTRDRAFT_133963 [Gloeophyllum trabeum ATCC 11539]|uniref:Protein kinase domain-containing protein n=1 Tax=Gloeophyllum trabeum (strain ATCC 11539 / FP-39264 / Madison 617) TaxID=670483 RepID=S7R7S4_GLOTA|nr:uncharacterized protein GLOTRDRAFT_133963 [Gloeophyllum trabeum ATCC 11539]EPQ50410.1 hypothetical protein GLOTRDRAFT_133963 [Gloeophyllum trabeum ATCC 11539]
MTVRMMIANLIYIEGCKLGICEVHPEASTIPCRGALNQREIVVGEGAREEKQWGVVHELAFTSDGDILKKDFSSFDLFTMQRCEDAWDTFKAWRRAAEAEAEQSPLMPGMKLEVEWNGVENRHTLWRAQEDEYHRAIPEDSARIASRYMRPKDQSVQDLVNASLKTGKLWFEIVEAKRTGPRKYSQIFFGKICGRGPLLCLKLFDERYVPYPEDPKDPHAPIVKWYLPASERLLNLNFAADMIRREESVYDRLKHFQGSLIPHCYGFHVFILPGGWRFPGFFTEVIDAPSFGQCRVQEWPKEDQCDFVTRLRHCVRVLKFAGIEQTDWHGGQILCPLSPIEMARPESREIVFIDFAFARQRLGEHKGKPITHDEALLKLMLRGYKLDSDVINECWFEPADEEY